MKKLDKIVFRWRLKWSTGQTEQNTCEVHTHCFQGGDQRPLQYTSSDSFILLGQFTLCIDFAARKGQSCWIQQDRKPAESLVCPKISA